MYYSGCKDDNIPRHLQIKGRNVHYLLLSSRIFVKSREQFYTETLLLNQQDSSLPDEIRHMSQFHKR